MFAACRPTRRLVYGIVTSEMGRRAKEENEQYFGTVGKVIRTRALSIASPVFYR